jgi:CheY-like chemotaxis protein
MRRSPAISYFDPGKVITLEIDFAPTDVPSIEAPRKGAPEPAQRVLLLEDGDDFRAVLRDHLGFRGFEVTAVPSGVEGLRKIGKTDFDLIVCDMMMPRMGGEMFYWAVTRMRPAAAQRFIFFTGHRNNPAIEFFFKRVSAPVLIKPFKLKELDSTIEAVLRKAV